MKAEMTKKTQVEAKHVDAAVGRISGVKLGDSKVAAAQKAIETMKLAGFSSREIKKAEKMLETYKSRTGEEQ